MQPRHVAAFQILCLGGDGTEAGGVDCTYWTSSRSSEGRSSPVRVTVRAEQSQSHHGRERMDAECVAPQGQLRCGMTWGKGGPKGNLAGRLISPLQASRPPRMAGCHWLRPTLSRPRLSISCGQDAELLACSPQPAVRDIHLACVLAKRAPRST